MRRALVVAVCLVVAAAAFFVFGRGGDEPLRLTVAGTRYAVTVLIGEPVAGKGAVEVVLDSGDADAVVLSAVMPEMGHATPEVVAREPEPGRFLAEGGLFSMAGVWELAIRLTGPPGEEVLTVKALITGSAAEPGA
jgi:hypothetical protein